MTDLAKKGETFCMLRLTWALSFDLITSFIFGLEAGSNFLADVSKIDAITDAYDNRYPHETFWKKETPGLHKLLAACGLSPLGRRNAKYQKAKKFLEAFTLSFCHRADAVLKRRGAKAVSKESGDYPMVYAAMRIAVDKEYPHLSEKAKMTLIASEMFDHLCKYSHNSRVLVSIFSVLTWFHLQPAHMKSLVSYKPTHCASSPRTTPPSPACAPSSSATRQQRPSHHNRQPLSAASPTSAP